MLGQTIYVKKIEEQDRERRLEKNKEKEKKKIDIQPSISSDEKLQSTTYHQVEFKRESLKKRELPKKRRQLILSDLIIQRLLESSRFNKAVSVGKFLKVVQALTINDEPESVISKKFTIDVEMVELIKKEFE